METHPGATMYGMRVTSGAIWSWKLSHWLT